MRTPATLGLSLSMLAAIPVLTGCGRKAPVTATAPATNSAVFHENREWGLVGVKKVAVLVSVDDALQAAGVSEDRIRTEIELRLQKIGIKVMDDRNYATNDGILAFFAQAAPADDKPIDRSNFYAYRLTVDFARWVVPVDVNLKEAHAEQGGAAGVWDDGSFGTVGKGNVKELEVALEERADKFINSYMKANQ